jgi:hypothetical protein
VLEHPWTALFAEVTDRTSGVLLCLCVVVRGGQRRRIAPLCSVAAVLPDWEFRFNQTGIPVVEPVFASVQPSTLPGAQVHGVLHKMTRDEYAHLLLTEGGAGRPGARGYQSVEVECTTYSGHRVKAFTLSSNNRTEGALPSHRYLTLCRNGAKAHGLHPAYQKYLSTKNLVDSPLADTHAYVHLTLRIPTPLRWSVRRLSGA